MVPPALWTIVSLIGFAISLVWLDRCLTMNNVATLELEQPITLELEAAKHAHHRREPHQNPPLDGTLPRFALPFIEKSNNLRRRKGAGLEIVCGSARSPSGFRQYSLA